ncbi:outer membrane protein assembly factor BamA [Prosthecobacter sp.]|jgi:outer membrane protein insertion porin family|uniref:outer membrane protein assembly factor BamA n=1 Tax=Prosthecobacter sp. TaxID=1965333 RepID=UPI003783F4D0
MNQGLFSKSCLALFVTTALSLMIAAPCRVQAQSVIPVAPDMKRIVKDVQIILKGGVKLDENRVRSQLSTRVGQPFTDEAVERDIRALYSTGAVENLDIRAVDVAGGVKVIVEITGRGGIGDIAFLGNTVFDSKDLIKKSEINIGDPVDDGKLTAGQQKIVEAYEKKGYSDVIVSYEIAQSAREGFSSVVYKIDEGARGIIHDIRFEGNTAISARKLRAKLKSKEHHFWNLWGKKGKLNNQDLQEDIKIIEQSFQDEGYVYAKVTEVRREPVSAKEIDIVYVISEGARYDVSGVTLSGNTIYSQDELMKGIRQEAGFPYKGSFVKADEKMIQDYYGSRGYADARVETSILESAPGQVAVAYSITEGAKSYISKVNISGNSVTKDEVIRRELPFAPGEELNTVKIEAGKNRLQNLNYFSAVDVRNTPSLNEGYKDVDINVVEQSTGTVNFGAGLSSIDSLTAFIAVTQTNFDISDWKDFRGGGQRFNANIRAGALRRDASVSWTEPWFMGRPLALTVDLFYRNLFFISNRFDQTEAGAAVSLRKQTGEHSFIDGGITLQQVQIDNIDPAATALIRQEAGSYMQSKLNVSWSHVTIDNIFLPRTGHRFEAGVFASALDVEAYGASVTGQQFFNLVGDTILSFEGSFRAAQNWGGTRLPIFERLFLGGANNMRGFDFREAGPKDNTGEPLGGTTAIFLSAEYTVPVNIMGASADKAPRVAFFGDVSSISGATGAFVGNGDIYSDIGIGLRLFLPIGPIRVDYAIPVDTDQFSDSGRFQFNMGYRF